MSDCKAEVYLKNFLFSFPLVCHSIYQPTSANLQMHNDKNVNKPERRENTRKFFIDRAVSDSSLQLLSSIYHTKTDKRRQLCTKERQYIMNFTDTILTIHNQINNNYL